jgi:serine/threonine protein kinase
MTEEQWRAAWAVFRAVEDLPVEEAGDFLDRAAVNPEVRGVVAQMLQTGRSRADSLISRFTSGRNQETAQPPSLSLAAGIEIDRYVLLKRVGEGGMGEVWLAAQREPVLRRVALKLIKTGWNSREVVARFQSERQALALMDHPGIAKVFDAGSTPQGAPYFVMEYAQGDPITDYCDSRTLPTRQRLELFIQVCEAVQHAHRKAIIHRDLKPSNILVVDVEGRPAPKIIDFGIAKAVNQKLSADTIYTRLGALVGTPEYMSPEQAVSSGDDIDTRTDVYSLGVIFYELLAGARPIEFKQMGLEEFLRRLREQDTPKPSTRLSTGDAATSSEVARRRQTEPAALARHLRGDLDAIALKALEKDRERRYESAGAMARDLERYLAGEAVEARPPSRAYRSRKFAMRHRWALGAAAALVLLLVAAVIWMSVALHQQSRANTDAAALRDVVRRIIIERPTQLAEIPNRTALRGQLMRDAEGALNALSQDSGGDSALEMELARANLEIGLAKGPYSAAGSEGDPAGAAVYVKRAVELYTRLARKRPGDPEVRRGQIEALSTWLHLQYRLVRNEEGEQAARQLENEISGMTPDLREKVQANWYLSIGYMELGAILWSQGRDAEGLALHRKALETFRGGIPAEWMKDPEKLDHLSHLERELAISTWMFEGPSHDAELMQRRSVETVAGCRAADCRMRHAQAEGTLGEIEWASGKREQGIATLRKSLAEFEVLAAEDPGNAVFANAGAQVRAYLALALAAGPSNESSEAVSLARKNLRLTAGAEASLNKGRERTMVNQITLGAALLGDRRIADAVREFREALESNRDWNANYDLRWSALHLLARAFEAQGRFEEAVSAAKTAMKFAVLENGGQGFSTQVIRATAARDYASAVAGWKGSSQEERVDALRALDAYCSRPGRPGGVIAGALIEWLPTPEEVASIRARLGPR